MVIDNVVSPGPVMTDVLTWLVFGRRGGRGTSGANIAWPACRRVQRIIGRRLWCHAAQYDPIGIESFRIPPSIRDRCSAPSESVARLASARRGGSGGPPRGRSVPAVWVLALPQHTVIHPLFTIRIFVASVAHAPLAACWPSSPGIPDGLGPACVSRLTSAVCSLSPRPT